MQIISTDKAPGAIGPYSQGVRAGGFIFSSGQIALSPSGGPLPEGPVAQTRQAMENLKVILEAAGSGLHKIVKVTIFLQDMDHFELVNNEYAKYFGSKPPARSCVQVARLPKGALVEIEAVALE